MKLVALVLVLLLWAGLGSAHVHRRGERGANGLADDSDDDTNKGEGSPQNHPWNPPNVEHKESHRMDGAISQVVFLELHRCCNPAGESQ